MQLERRIAMAATALITLVWMTPADAIPPFARKYGTSCTTCHEGIPRLNATGEAFKKNGYRFFDDAEMIKEEPLQLGNEIYKKIWPKATYPSDIPAQIPLAIRTQMLGVGQLESDKSDVDTDFRMPNNLWILAGGTVGSNFSFFMHAHALSEGEAEFSIARIYIQYNDLLPNLWGENVMNIKVGQFEPAAVPFSSFTNLTLTNFALNSYSFTMENEWGGGHHGGALALGRNQRGIEINGIIRDRLFYGFGVVNGNGTSFGDETYDMNGSKDVYGRLALKIGGLSTSGYPGEDAEGNLKSANWPEKSLQLGVFGYFGNNEQEDMDLTEVDAEDVEKYQQFGFDATVRLGRLELLGGMYFGNVDLHRQIVRQEYEQEYTVQMVQASLRVYPWLHPYYRYEFVDRDDQQDLSRHITGVSAMIRSNVKFSAEWVADEELPDVVLIGLDLTF